MARFGSLLYSRSLGLHTSLVSATTDALRIKPSSCRRLAASVNRDLTVDQVGECNDPEVGLTCQVIGGFVQEGYKFIVRFLIPKIFPPMSYEDG